MSAFDEQYRLHRTLGHGRLGPLEEAEQLALHRTVVIRFLHPHFPEDAVAAVDKVLTTLGRIDDGCLLPTIDRGRLLGRTYYVVEKVDGVDLEHADPRRIAGDGADRTSLGRDARVRALAAFLQGLKRLHQAGVDLQQVSTTEVLVAQPLRFVLSEPGVAAVLHGRPREPGSLRHLLQRLLTFVFDPIWDTLSPEPGTVPGLQKETQRTVFLRLSGAGADEPPVLLDRCLASLQASEPATTPATEETPTRRLTSRSQTRRIRTRAYTIGLAVALASSAWWLVRGTLRSVALDGERRSAEAAYGALKMGDAARLAELGTGGGLERFPGLTQRLHDLVERDRERALHRAVLDLLGALRDGGHQAVASVAATNLEVTDPRVRGIREFLEKPDFALRLATLLRPGDGRQVAFDTFIRLADEVPELLRRATLLLLLEDRDATLSRAAAAALAVGFGGTGRELDDDLASLVERSRIDPAVLLGLVAYFATAGEHGAARLRELAVLPGDSRAAPNPRDDRTAAELCALRCGTEDVLDAWLGLPNDRAPATFSLRFAAILALEKCGSATDTALFVSLLDDSDPDCVYAAALALARRLTALGQEEAVRLIRKHAATPGSHAWRPLLLALGRATWPLALDCAVGLVADHPDEAAAVVATLVDADLFTSASDFARVICGCELRTVESLSEHLAQRPRVADLLNRYFDAGPDRQAALPLALLAGRLGISRADVSDVLVAALEDRAQPAITRARALRALVRGGHDVATNFVQQVLHTPGYDTEFRALALVVAPELLSERPSDFLRYKEPVPANDRRRVALLQSILRVAYGSDAHLRRLAVAVAASYDHPDVRVCMADLIRADSDTDLLRIATDYFASQFAFASDAREFGDLARIESAMLDVLARPEIEEEIRGSVIDFLSWTGSERGVEIVAKELASFESEALQEDALAYLTGHLASEDVAASVLELLEIGTETAPRVHALSLLAGLPRYRDTIRSLAGTDADAIVALRAAEALFDAGERVEPALVVDALARHFRRSRTATTTTTTSRVTRPTQFLRQAAIPGLDEALAQWMLDTEVALPDALAPLTLLALRLQYSGADARILRGVLTGLEIPLATFVAALPLQAEASVDPLDPLDPLAVARVLDFLCAQFPDEPAPFKARAQLRRFDATALLVDDPAVDTDLLLVPEKEVEAIARDIETAIRLDDDYETALILKLARAYERLGRIADAIAHLEAHVLRRPSDVEPRVLLCDLQALQGDFAGARGTLQSIPRRQLLGAPYWSRVLELTVRDPSLEASAKERNLLADLDAANARNESYCEVVASVLAFVFDQRGEALPLLRLRLRQDLSVILRTAGDWPARGRAAFHLGWLGTADDVEVLRRAARSDTKPDVRRSAALALWHLAPDAAFEVAREGLGHRRDPAAMDHALREAYLRIVAHRDPSLLRQVLEQGMHPRSPWSTQSLATAGRIDAHELIPQITRLLRGHPAATVRAAAAATLGTLAKQGHEVDRGLLRSTAAWEADSAAATAALGALAGLRDAAAQQICADRIRAYMRHDRVALDAPDLVVHAIRILAESSPDAVRPLLAELVSTEMARFGNGDANQLETSGLLARDDEALGDLADEAWLLGLNDIALRLYRRAAALDPDDSEWQTKIADLEAGLPLPAGLTHRDGLVIAVARQTLAQLETPGPRPPENPAAPDDLVSRALALARGHSTDSPQARQLHARVARALDELGQWLQLAFAHRDEFGHAVLARAPDVVLATTAADDLHDAFQGRVPAALLEWLRLSEVLPELARALCEGTAEDPSSWPEIELRRRVAERWQKLLK